MNLFWTSNRFRSLAAQKLSSPAMSPRTAIITIIVFFWFGLISASERGLVLESAPAIDIHDLLPQYGFPRGLLPNNVESYTLSAGGFFRIQLESPCYVQFDQLVYYDKEIEGKLSYGSVSDVSGIQAKKLFLWLSVTGIQVDQSSGMIEFFVGSLSQKLPANQFEDVPGCVRKGSARSPASLFS